MEFKHFSHYKSDLLAVKLPADLSAEQICSILRELDLYYGDTDQDTTVWALEYQLWARFLLHDNALLVNPRYLELTDEVMSTIFRILGDELNVQTYQNAQRVEISEVLSRFKANSDIEILTIY